MQCTAITIPTCMAEPHTKFVTFPMTNIGRSKRLQLSRRMCCRLYMNHLVTCGTPCHVSQKPEATSGSDNTVVARHKPGIAFEMIGDMPSFKSPVTGKLFRSKSYVAYDPPRGMSAYEFLGYDNPSPLPYFGFTNKGECWICR